MVLATHKYGYEEIGAWAVGLILASLKKGIYPPDYNFLPLLDVALALGASNIQEQVTRIIKEKTSGNNEEFLKLFTYAEGKTHEAWKRLLGWAYYQFAFTPIWDKDLAAPLSPKRKRMFEAARVKIRQMKDIDLSRDHTCDDRGECDERLRAVLKSHERYDDFVLWARELSLRRRPRPCDEIDRCVSFALSLYEVQACNLVVRSWDFFNDLEY